MNYIRVAKKSWMDSYNFGYGMDHFTILKTKESVISSSMTHLFIFHGYKSHVNIKVVEKAKKKGTNMVTLPSHTSHGLQSLDVSCFGPFKQSFRAFRNA